jgi:hypothetical protein
MWAEQTTDIQVDIGRSRPHGRSPQATHSRFRALRAQLGEHLPLPPTGRGGVRDLPGPPPSTPRGARLRSRDSLDGPRSLYPRPQRAPGLAAGLRRRSARAGARDRPAGARSGGLRERCALRSSVGRSDVYFRMDRLAACSRLSEPGARRIQPAALGPGGASASTRPGHRVGFVGRPRPIARRGRAGGNRPPPRGGARA